MYPGSLKQNQTFRLSKGTGLRIENIYHHVLQFVDGIKKFMDAGSMLDAVRSGRPRISAENIESARQSFSCFPMKSIYTAARKLELSPTTVHKVLHKRLLLHAYKMQMLQRRQPNDKPKRKKFADNMLQRIFEDEEFSKDVLGRPLLTALNIDPASINFLCHRRIEERDVGYFPCLVLCLR